MLNLTALYRIKNVSSIKIWSHPGLFPLSLSLPLMYYPKIFDGDTQPWVLLGGLVALFSFRLSKGVSLGPETLILGLICTASVCAFAVRSNLDFWLLRFAYINLAFVVIWAVCRRDSGEYLSSAVRYTITVWFAVGIVQYVLLLTGYEIEFVGRYYAGRSGVPSLTSEPSTYGSLSVLQMMVLLEQHSRKNRLYIVMALASVVLSGSLLAFLMLTFPLMLLPLRYQILAMLVLPPLVLLDYHYTTGGLTARILSMGIERALFQELFVDASLNLRFGHVYFTMIENFGKSLIMSHSMDFMNQYNYFAASTTLLIDTGSDYILPAAGEAIYGGGLFGLFIVVFIVWFAVSGRRANFHTLVRGAFVVTCLLNPISISNVFLLLYVVQRRPTQGFIQLPPRKMPELELLIR